MWQEYERRLDEFMKCHRNKLAGEEESYNTAQFIYQKMLKACPDLLMEQDRLTALFKADLEALQKEHGEIDIASKPKL